MTLLDEITARITNLPPAQAQKLAIMLNAAAPQFKRWAPNPGSQTEAYFSEADVTGYGGEAGPGKTDLLIGLSLTAHHRSLLLRRTNKEARKFAERFSEILGTRDGLNSSDGVWRLPNRVVDYGGVELEDDKQKYKGDPHDLIAFDEVVDFTRSQFEFLIQWNRPAQSAPPDQRCRVVATFNPPTRPTGLWVIEFWGPWLDPKHPNPAKSGELRWFTTIDGKDTEVDGPGPHLIEGEYIKAKSRTFIRGYLHENPHLMAAGYDATRAAAPKKMRQAYRAGDFEAALADVPNQCIPSAWVRAAQARWTPEPPRHAPMCAIGIDVSGGGDDPMVLAPRHDAWFAPLIEIPGEELPVERMAAVSAGIVISHRRDGALPVVDLGGGYGGGLYERLIDNGIEVLGFKGAAASHGRTRDRRHPFVNKRTDAYWTFREALDPDQPGGSPVALPPGDSKLYADLTAPIFEILPRGIALEPKEKVVERLGRSTDHGDAVVMAWSGGARLATHGAMWRDMARNWQQPQPIRAYENRKRR